MIKFNKKFGLVVVTFVTGKFDYDYGDRTFYYNNLESIDFLESDDIAQLVELYCKLKYKYIINYKISPERGFIFD